MYVYIYIHTCIYSIYIYIYIYRERERYKDRERERDTDRDAHVIHSCTISLCMYELDVAIGKMKNNKTPGPNRVTSELMKLLGDEGRDRLLSLMNSFRPFGSSQTQHDLSTFRRTKAVRPFEHRST